MNLDEEAKRATQMRKMESEPVHSGAVRPFFRFLAGIVCLAWIPSIIMLVRSFMTEGITVDLILESLAGLSFFLFFLFIAFGKNH